MYGIRNEYKLLSEHLYYWYEKTRDLIGIKYAQGTKFKCWFDCKLIDDNTNKYIRPLVNKGGENDVKIDNQYFLSDSILIPCLQE